jgi:SsrA-binding protein
MAKISIARNRKASFEYFLLEHYEAGLVLKGSEIKSIRARQVSIAEAYIQIEDNQAWLLDSHIAPYDPASRENHDPKRKRKLLLNKKEIIHIWQDIKQRGLTVVPTEIYIKDGKAKIDIAVAKGKKLYDKRREIAQKDYQRDLAREGNRKK